MNFTTLCYKEKENQYKAKITWKEIKRKSISNASSSIKKERWE